MNFVYAVVAGVVACGKANPTDKNTRRVASISPAPFAQELSARPYPSEPRVCEGQIASVSLPKVQATACDTAGLARFKSDGRDQFSDAATPLKPARLAGWAFPAGINGMALRAASVRSDGASPSKS
jgi:hypothetical protein